MTNKYSEAGRLCEEEDCCEYGDTNNIETECCKCSREMIPSEEHNKDYSELFQKYYGSEEDDGDICYECLCKIEFEDSEDEATDEEEE
jgi:hypothetical protein